MPCLNDRAELTPCGGGQASFGREMGLHSLRAPPRKQGRAQTDIVFTGRCVKVSEVKRGPDCHAQQRGRKYVPLRSLKLLDNPADLRDTLLCTHSAKPAGRPLVHLK